MSPVLEFDVEPGCEKLLGAQENAYLAKEHKKYKFVGNNIFKVCSTFSWWAALKIVELIVITTVAVSMFNALCVTTFCLSRPALFFIG